MKLTIIGSGYVGLTTGACFAEVGHHVMCVDSDPQRVTSLEAGTVPFFEPGLQALVTKNVAARRLYFSGSVEDGVNHGEVLFITVPTPPLADGSVDLTFVEKVAREIAQYLDSYRVIVDKSTVPVKTGERVTQTIRKHAKPGVEFDVVSNPEFLREGSAVTDLMKPDRIVVGGDSDRALALMQKIYEPFVAPVLVTDINSAELIKHAANSFLALKISYINALAELCELSGADVLKVAEGIGADKRIGRGFLNAGLGYGGSCFPKDVAAFIAISEQLGQPLNLLKEVQVINSRQSSRFLEGIREALWVLKDKKIAVWGLSFKPNTDDIRSSVAVNLVEKLVSEGASVSVYDPQAMTKFRETELAERVSLAESPLAAAKDAEALIIATEWPEFSLVDLAALRQVMSTPLIFDGRNLLDPIVVRDFGFQYRGVGRGLAVERR